MPAIRTAASDRFAKALAAREGALTMMLGEAVG